MKVRMIDRSTADVVFSAFCNVLLLLLMRSKKNLVVAVAAVVFAVVFVVVDVARTGCWFFWRALEC